MTAKNPQGAWGPYGGKSAAFKPFGWALVNANGTFAASSGNLGMMKGSTGNYILQPLDDKGNPAHFAVGGLVPMPVITGGIPFMASPTFGLGPTADGIQVLVYNVSASPAVLADEGFYFLLFTTA